MIFESHAHYDDEAFNEDRELLLKSMGENGIEYIVNVSADLNSAGHTLELMESYPFIYGALGVHPDEVSDLKESDMNWIEDKCRHRKTVAVGEIGLDYYWDKADHALQKKWFEQQLELARRALLPVIIHSREAAMDTFELMHSLQAEDMGGVIHCFSYGKEMAAKFLNMGYYLGIGGVVTFKNARKLKEVVAYAPLKSLLLETDSPYLSPVPNRGKRNTSLNIPYIAKEIAAIKEISYDEVIQAASINAKRLFLKCV